MSKMKFLVGADPELFLMKDGKFHSAHGVIPGDKHRPHKVACGAVQVDGMALEFNIDPAESEEMFLRNITTVREVLESMVPGFQVVPSPTANFDHEYMEQQPPEAKELGCEPDYNAWKNGARNPKPNGRVNFRTGAGHVHVGWCDGMDLMNAEHLDACIMATKQLDCVLGLGSLLYDSDDTRRTLYGKAGAFRPKSYGVEYRTLSNAWLQSKELTSWVYKSTIDALNALLDGRKLWKELGEKYVVETINGSIGRSYNDCVMDARYMLEDIGFKGIE